MKSVEGIKKITQSMKLVAAARVRQATIRLDFVRAFQKGISEMWPKMDKKEGKDGEEAKKSKILVVPITADRGLCGAANASVSRKARAFMFDLRDKGQNFAFFPIGVKGKNGLARFFPNAFTTGINEIGKIKVLNFRMVCCLVFFSCSSVFFFLLFCFFFVPLISSLCRVPQPSMLADLLLKEETDEYVLIYNYFRNMLVYESREERIPSFTNVKNQLTATLSSKFEIESTFVVTFFFASLFCGFLRRFLICSPFFVLLFPGGGYSDTLRNFYEYRFAVRLYHTMQETATVEISARMNAMGNSSKAAGDLLNVLRMEYNRTRQAKITTELVEVVSGALFAAS
jgi:F0F1-type ATP synthase gamma subunit